MRTKLLASSMLVAAMFTACQSESDEAIVDSSEMVEVSFGIGGEFTAEDGVLTRATTTFDYYYVAVSASAASNGNISSGYVDYFTSLTGVSLSLPKGTYNVYISAYKQDGYTIDWSSVNSSLTAGSFKEVSAATATAPDFADQKVDRYYGSTSQAINTNATVTVNGKRFAYGVNVDIEKPLEGKVVLSSTSPAFSYTATTAAVTASNIYSLAGTDASTASKSMDVTMTLYDASNAVVATQTKTITIARNHMKTLKVKALDPKASFDFSAEDEDMTDDGENDLTPTVHNGHQYVDMGFPNHVLWATCNVGASSPEEDGNYYAWGEVTTKTDYSSSTWNYVTDVSFKSTDKDVAHVVWGGNWYTPTVSEWKYFTDNYNYVTWSQVTRNGVSGYLATSTVNGNTLFFPTSAYMEGTTKKTSQGVYWASDRESGQVTTKGAKQAIIKGSEPGYAGSTYTYYGLPVRPVCKLQ